MKPMHAPAAERADLLTDAEKHRKARNLAWSGVTLLFVSSMLAPSNWGLAVGIGGMGIFALGSALHNTRQRGGRILQVAGAAVVIADIVLIITDIL
jgi:hypothetical protein